MVLSENLERFLKYLQFKGSCAAYQEANPIRFDKDRAERNLVILQQKKAEKVEALKKVMPLVPKYKTKVYPAKMYNQDETLSAHGQKWFEFLREQKLPVSTKEDVRYVYDHTEPNPNSPDQVKDWLFGLGWEPCTFDYKKNIAGEERAIPQVRSGGDLTDSVMLLVDKHEDVLELEELTVINHRISVFNGFINNSIEKDGKFYLTASIHGLTNTLRFKHVAPLVNLPGVDKPYGEEIRGCLIAEDGEVMVGCDMVSLEDTTKRHYMQPLDPDYVEEMSKDGFDPHLDLAKFAGVISQEDIDEYNNGSESKLKPVRKVYKAANYSCVYGVRPKTLSRQSGLSMSEASTLIDNYWERNWSIKRISSDQKVKESHNYNWLQNPISGFWYELRYDKDRFSTLNQGTGVYIFDSWLARASELGYMGQMQFHDETAVSTSDPDQVIAAMEGAIRVLNDDLQLNIEMKIDYQKGSNYAEIH